ncbi:MAG TPA: hypothetical protein PKE65_05240 [Rhizobiaceae bacterium]|nr:hypothetical protein [Rhizobiaceae bacterium]
MLKAALIFLATGTGGLNLYPGFVHPGAQIEATIDKGLILEIIVRCGRDGRGRPSPGIMSYSKVERLYCSSKNRCFNAPEAAYRDTCG